MRNTAKTIVIFILSKQNEERPINIENGSFNWESTGSRHPKVLSDVNISVKKGSLVAVVGHVGSGKSSLMSAMLGEMNVISGYVNTSGKISYVPQQAWMQNETLKNNITFGKKYNENLYKKVLESCALIPDLQILQAGDQTEIGEKGINLSGGQKQRISMARAVYSNGDLYLLDDPLRYLKKIKLFRICVLSCINFSLHYYILKQSSSFNTCTI